VRIYLYSLVVLAMRMAMHVARAMRSGTHLVTKREREREREGGGGAATDSVNTRYTLPARAICINPL